MPFGTNDHVRVKLTPEGLARYRRHARALMDGVPGRARGRMSAEPQVDAEGYARLQFWELMEIFGPGTGLLKPQMFESEMLVEIRDGVRAIAGDPEVNARPKG